MMPPCRGRFLFFATLASARAAAAFRVPSGRDTAAATLGPWPRASVAHLALTTQKVAIMQHTRAARRIAHRVLHRRPVPRARRPISGLACRASRERIEDLRCVFGAGRLGNATSSAFGTSGRWAAAAARRASSAAATAAGEPTRAVDVDTEELIRSYAEKRQTPVSMHVLMQTGYGSLLPPHLLQSEGAREHADAGDAQHKQAATVLQVRSTTHPPSLIYKNAQHAMLLRTPREI